jgi:anti-sigma regulatory factor (Ser/Thr protein kinase)
VLLLTQSHDGIVVLRVGGPVGAGDAPALVCAVGEAVAAAPGGVVVDLALADPVDAQAVAALRSATRDPAVTVVGSPPALSVDTRPEIVVEYGPHGPAQARAAVERWSTALGAELMCDDLKLIVSELVTNAVRYGAPPVRVAVAADAVTVTVTVVDGSPGRPLRREPGVEAENGRGLLLVDLLCAEHGVRDEPPGKAVWAAVRRP